MKSQQTFLIYRMHTELVQFARLSLQEVSPSRGIKSMVDILDMMYDRRDDVDGKHLHDLNAAAASSFDVD
eukprot:868791-Karenia_brevis.AAC.1